MYVYIYIYHIYYRDRSQIWMVTGYFSFWGCSGDIPTGYNNTYVYVYIHISIYIQEKKKKKTGLGAAG